MSNLTYERAIEIFRYDEENGLLIRKTFRNGCPYNKPCGDKPDSHGRGVVKIDGKVYLTHRVIWLLVYREWPENEIDHIDRNPMNNRIENLRAATRTENQHNHGLRKDNSSGYPGVSFHTATNKYRAYICLNGKITHLGLFPTPEAAHTSYMLAKIKYHPTSPIVQELSNRILREGY